MKRMKSLRILTIGLLLGLSGCAAYTTALTRDDAITPQDAFLYGRFSIEAPTALLAMNSHRSMGFVLDCEDKAQYIIRFANKDPLQVFRIVPSTCSMTEIVYTDADGVIRSRKPAPAGVLKSSKFEAGKAYYLGDFFAKTTVTSSYNTIHTRWTMDKVANDYDKTTSEMKAAFPKLSAIPTEVRLISK